MDVIFNVEYDKSKSISGRLCLLININGDLQVFVIKLHK